MRASEQRLFPNSTVEAPWKLGEAEAWIAKVYWELLEYPAQTVHHAQEALLVIVSQ